MLSFSECSQLINNSATLLSNQNDKRAKLRRAISSYPNIDFESCAILASFLEDKERIDEDFSDSIFIVSLMVNFSFGKNKVDSGNKSDNFGLAFAKTAKKNKQNVNIARKKLSILLNSNSKEALAREMIRMTLYMKGSVSPDWTKTLHDFNHWNFNKTKIARDWAKGYLELKEKI